ncbi:MAG: methyltransferase [Flavobacteriales bacterium]|nr:methyltransferase [Flavobacteriales bacterium]
MEPFHFKQFSVRHDRSAIKVGTDAVLLGAWTNYDKAERILDIGTGCGVLALIAAQRNGTARIDGIEIDTASAEEARANAASSPWNDRLRIHNMDARKLVSSDRYELIISNPPFYAGEEASPDSRKSVAKHSGELTFNELLCAADKLLAADGRISVVLPLNREKDFLTDAALFGLKPNRRCVVRYLGSRPPKRVMLELGRRAEELEQEEITVESTQGEFSAGYRTLLSDLLMKF